MTALTGPLPGNSRAPEPHPEPQPPGPGASFLCPKSPTSGDVLRSLGRGFDSSGIQLSGAPARPASSTRCPSGRGGQGRGPFGSGSMHFRPVSWGLHPTWDLGLFLHGALTGQTLVAASWHVQDVALLARQCRQCPLSHYVPTSGRRAHCARPRERPAPARGGLSSTQLCWKHSRAVTFCYSALRNKEDSLLPVGSVGECATFTDTEGSFGQSSEDTAPAVTLCPGGIGGRWAW